VTQSRFFKNCRATEEEEEEVSFILQPPEHTGYYVEIMFAESGSV
jgi:hypothetical protein